MERWYRIAFVETPEFSDAGRRVDDALRHAGWPPELGVLVTDDWVHLGGKPSLVIYFSRASAERFASLIG